MTYFNFTYLFIITQTQKKKELQYKEVYLV